jgi:hypothetical protein
LQVFGAYIEIIKAVDHYSFFSFEMDEKRDSVNQIVDSMKRKYGEDYSKRNGAFVGAGAGAGKAVSEE